MHISASQLAVWQDCRLKWFYSRQEEIPSSDAQILGRTFHEWWAGEEVEDVPGLDRLINSFEKAGLSKAPPNHEVEHRLEIWPGMDLVVIFDAISFKGDVVILDEVKTFSKSPPNVYWTPQPWVYLAALSKLYPDTDQFLIRYTFVGPNRAWQEEEWKDRRDGEYKWEELVRFASEMSTDWMYYEEDKVPPPPSLGFHCYQCPFRSKCETKIQAGWYTEPVGWYVETT